MLGLVHILNQDRQNLKNLASKLLSIISQGELPKTPFENFIARTQHLNYQLQKKFLERERNHSEELESALKKLTHKETKESSAQTEMHKRNNISNISDIQLALDFSITSDTTTSPLNSSIDFSKSNSSFIGSAMTERGLKKPSTRLSMGGIKLMKKITDDHLNSKQVPTIRKNQVRKTK